MFPSISDFCLVEAAGTEITDMEGHPGCIGSVSLRNSWYILVVFLGRKKQGHGRIMRKEKGEGSAQ